MNYCACMRFARTKRVPKIQCKHFQCMHSIHRTGRTHHANSFIKFNYKTYQHCSIKVASLHNITCRPLTKSFPRPASVKSVYLVGRKFDGNEKINTVFRSRTQTHLSCDASSCGGEELPASECRHCVDSSESSEGGPIKLLLKL